MLINLFFSQINLLSSLTFINYENVIFFLSGIFICSLSKLSYFRLLKNLPKTGVFGSIFSNIGSDILYPQIITIIIINMIVMVTSMIGCHCTGISLKNSLKLLPIPLKNSSIGWSMDLVITDETTYEWNVYSMKITIKHSLRF